MKKRSGKTKNPAPAKIGIVSLGCAKALYDSERIVTHLRAEGYDFVPDYHGADLVIVNTCGFLESARTESLDAIGEALAENGKVIVTGCLGAEPEVILEKYPQISDITGPANYEAVIDAVHRARPPQHDPYFDLLPPGGLKFTPRHYAYLKISEGCNNSCRFCIIPDLRGRLVSRNIADVMVEAEKLASAGVKELLIVSQDTSAYGSDSKYATGNWRRHEYRSHVTDLCRALGELGIWIRLHYVYPYPHVDELMPMMAAGKILPYLDIPFQHASPSILKAMKRPANDAKVLERIKMWCQQVPDLVLRSTFIVGFPGETEDDFLYLLDWLQEAELDRVGCFKYEAVKGAKANELPNPVPEEVKQDRWDRMMQVQQEISAKRLAKRVGQTLEVIIDTSEKRHMLGRTKGDAPLVDGVVHLPQVAGLRAGAIVKAKINRSDPYDLFGVVVGAE